MRISGLKWYFTHVRDYSFFTLIYGKLRYIPIAEKYQNPDLIVAYSALRRFTRHVWPERPEGRVLTHVRSDEFCLACEQKIVIRSLRCVRRVWVHGRITGPVLYGFCNFFFATLVNLISDNDDSIDRCGLANRVIIIFLLLRARRSPLSVLYRRAMKASTLASYEIILFIFRARYTRSKHTSIHVFVMRLQIQYFRVENVLSARSIMSWNGRKISNDL